jgi:hypothetical protein
MLLGYLSLISLAAAQAAPTLASIEGLSPEAVGELVLQGREHGTVVKVAPAAQGHLDPPGLVKLELTERATAIPEGCVRRRWIATFRQAPGAAEPAATLSDAWAATEVALRPSSGCPAGRFVHVNYGLGIKDALGALEYLDHIRRNKGRVRFSCSDSTGSALCRNSGTTRQELVKLSAWAVTRRGGMTELWLGEPGQIVTSVIYSEALPDRITVKRSVPHSF